MNKFWAVPAIIFFSSISAQSLVVTQPSPVKNEVAATMVKESPSAIVPTTPVLNVTPELCKKVTPILHKIASKCLLETDRETRCKCYDAVAVKMEVKYKNCHGMFEEIKQDIANHEAEKSQSLQQKSCFK